MINTTKKNTVCITFSWIHLTFSFIYGYIFFYYLYCPYIPTQIFCFFFNYNRNCMHPVEFTAYSMLKYQFCTAQHFLNKKKNKTPLKNNV